MVQSAPNLLKSLKKLRRTLKNPSGPAKSLISLENLTSNTFDPRIWLSAPGSSPDHHRPPLGHEEANHKDILNLYSSENRSDHCSEEFSSEPYSSIVRSSDYSSVVSLIAIVERGQGPYSVVESE